MDFRFSNFAIRSPTRPRLSFNNRVRSWSNYAVPDVSEMCISRIKFGQLYIVAYLKIFFISLSLIITGPMALTTMIGIQQEMLYQELWLGNYRLLWSLGTFKMFQKRSKVFCTRKKRYLTFYQVGNSFEVGTQILSGSIETYIPYFKLNFHKWKTITNFYWVSYPTFLDVGHFDRFFAIQTIKIYSIRPILL